MVHSFISLPIFKKEVVILFMYNFSGCYEQFLFVNVMLVTLALIVLFIEVYFLNEENNFPFSVSIFILF